ncbi:MAG: hypothetical protein AAFX40_15835 [Cyanobacteria bacterium J06639_1]
MKYPSTYGQRYIAILSVVHLNIGLYRMLRDSSITYPDLVFLQVTAMICFFLYLGKNWARWLAILICGFLGGVGTIIGVVETLTGGTSGAVEFSPDEVLASLVFGLIYLTSLLILFIPSELIFSLMEILDY